MHNILTAHLFMPQQNQNSSVDELQDIDPDKGQPPAHGGQNCQEFHERDGRFEFFENNDEVQANATHQNDVQDQSNIPIQQFEDQDVDLGNKHPVLLLLYSYMQNLPNRSLSSHILFVVFVVVQGSQKTRVGKFGLVSKTLSIGIKSQVFDFGWCSSKAKKKIRYAQALCVALKLQGCWGKCSSMNFGCSTMQFEATQQRSLSLRPWQEAQLAYGVLPPLLPEFNAVEKTFNTG